MGQIEVANIEACSELEAKEKEQAPLIAKAEADRIAAIEAAKTELARYEAEVAPKSRRLRRSGLAEVAAQAAVKEYQEKKLATAQTNFEATVPVARTYTELDSAGYSGGKSDERDQTSKTTGWINS